MRDIPYNFPGEASFHTWPEIEEKINQFDTTRVIGRDQSGQFNMYEFTLGTPGKPIIMVTASMHGSEWQGAVYTVAFMEQLRDDTFPDKEFRDYLLNNFHLSVMPVLNPYGFQRTYYDNITRGRYLQNGADMNRDFSEFENVETRNVKEVMDGKKPFAYLDVHLIRGHNSDNHLIVGNGQYETTNIRDEWADSWEKYAGQTVVRWEPYDTLNSGLSRRYMRDKDNPHTPHTLSYITEMSRPVDEVDGFNAPLSDREIFQYGMASIYLFLRTSVDYYQQYNPDLFEPIIDRTLRVRDLEGKEYMLQASVTHEYELNGNQSLSFTVHPTKANEPFIHEIGEMWEVIDNDDVVHKVVFAKRQGRGQYDSSKSQLSVEIKAVPKFFDDFDNSRIYEEYNEHMTANRAFNRIFEGMDFEYILVSHFDAVNWEGFGAGESRLETFKRALERYKVEFRISGNIVYLEERIGRDTSFQYRHRLNATDIVHEIDANEFYTYAKGYGDYGSDQDDETTEGSTDWQDAELVQEYTSPLAEVIGIRHAPPVKNGNITTTETMAETLEELVDESLKISITANIHDLREQGYALAQPQIGDRVFVIDERIGLETELRIIDMTITRDWKGTVTSLSVTFGSEGLSKRHQSDISTATKVISDAIAGRKELPYTVLDSRVKQATETLRNAETELIFGGNGIVAKDTSDPNLVTILNSAGVGVSNNGGDTFRQAITGEGINASTVVTGTMLADYIAGGILTSLNDNTYFNLNNGNLDMENANFTLGSGARIDFNDNNNRITYRNHDDADNLTRSSGLGVGDRIGGRHPFSYMGTTGASELDTLSPYYSGFIANTTAAIGEGEANSVSGYRFELRNEAVDFDKGMQFDFNGDYPTIAPFNGHLYNYDLGESGSNFRRVYTNELSGNGSVVFRDTYGSGGWAMRTDWLDGENLYLTGLNSQDYNYNIGRSSNWLTYVYTNSLRTNYIRPDASNSVLGDGDNPFGTSHINTLTVNQNFWNNSLREYKENIHDLDLNDAIEFVRNNEVKVYNYKGSDEPAVGMIRDDLVGRDDLVANKTAISPGNVQYINQKVLQNLLERIEVLENGTESTK